MPTSVEDYWIEIASKPDPHNIRLLGGPIDEPRKHIGVFAAVGIVIAAWARTEQHIDAIIIQINRKNYSNEKLDLYDPNHPRPFSDKLDTLKRFFYRHPGLKEYKSRIANLTRSLGVLAKHRAIYAHGNLQEYEPKTEKVVFSVVEYKRKTNGFLCRTAAIPLEKLLELVGLINEINVELATISKELFVVGIVERLQTPEWRNRRWWQRILDRFAR